MFTFKLILPDPYLNGQTHCSTFSDSLVTVETKHQNFIYYDIELIIFLFNSFCWSV